MDTQKTTAGTARLLLLTLLGAPWLRTCRFSRRNPRSLCGKEGEHLSGKMAPLIATIWRPTARHLAQQTVADCQTRRNSPDQAPVPVHSTPEPMCAQLELPQAISNWARRQPPSFLANGVKSVNTANHFSWRITFFTMESGERISARAGDGLQRRGNLFPPAAAAGQSPRGERRQTAAPDRGANRPTILPQDVVAPTQRRWFSRSKRQNIFPRLVPVTRVGAFLAPEAEAPSGRRPCRPSPTKILGSPVKSACGCFSSPS